MPQFTISLIAVETTYNSDDPPTFDGTGRGYYGVSDEDLNRVKATLTSPNFVINCTSIQLLGKLQDQANLRIHALSLPMPITCVIPIPSIPNGPVWSNSSTEFLHPSENGTNVCVRAAAVGPTFNWRMIGFNTGIPMVTDSARAARPKKLMGKKPRNP